MSLVVKDLYKKYGEKVVVDHISFEMTKPGVYALLGSNGAGKTTTIRMILGMLDRDGGEVTWNGKPLTFDNCNIGYLAEERGLYPKYTLIDQIRYFGELRGVDRKTIDERIRDADGYVFENSDSEYLTASQLSSIKTPTQLRIAINEIYARHGYSFIKNPSIQRYFDAKNWYYKDEYLYEDSQMVWNTYEDANLKTLAKLRKGKLKYNPSSELSV